jgi:hypothetical protein
VPIKAVALSGEEVILINTKAKCKAIKRKKFNLKFVNAFIRRNNLIRVLL